MRRTPSVVPATRLRLADVVDEAVAGMLARPGRAALTVLGTLLGVAAFVTVLGLTSTVEGQISSRFTALVATEVVVQDGAEQAAAGAEQAFPADAEQRLAALNGVRDAGVFWEVPDVGRVAARRASAEDPGEQLRVLAASPGYLRAIHAHLAAGRLFDAWHDRTGERVVVLGSGAAGRLGVTWVDDQPAVFIGGAPFAVIGIVDDVDRKADTLLSVVLPAGTARAVWGDPPVGGSMSVQAMIDTEIGAAQQVGAEAPLALRPQDPARFKVVTPPDPRQLREGVNTDLGTLFLALAAVCLVIGAVGIANTTLVAVLERVGEIGLRRSLGARRRHVAVHFLAESGTLGLVGGLIGTSLGVAAVVAVALWRDWTPILHSATVLPAPLVGAATGLLAGLYPAWRASRIEPADALRR
ncbi:putative ABC transport system permease protein [Actinoplanes octamycinicus]|uniref:Putative ABC transport system permease protein n=1 Tax=Actinoplanes octamycinicus TaxID=135948 RepID=A0A7W7H0A8_9ACTN|nr:ABC transporter permease [Actinoplanes octamycinicus]MBB4741522.1 putative ABC transport system permease protein [Actinoplanes octamycinicus]